MADDKNKLDGVIFDPLETPQIAHSKRAMRRLGKGEPMPGLNVDSEDGEVDKTIDERLRDLNKSLQEKKTLH